MVQPFLWYIPGIAEIRVSFAILSGTSSSGMFSSHKQFLFPELLTNNLCNTIKFEYLVKLCPHNFFSSINLETYLGEIYIASVNSHFNKTAMSSLLQELQPVPNPPINPMLFPVHPLSASWCIPNLCLKKKDISDKDDKLR